MDHMPQQVDDTFRFRNVETIGHQATHSPLDPTSELVWKDFKTIDLDGERLKRHHIVTVDRYDAVHAVFDMIRTKLLQTLRKNEWKSVAITSPTASCGKTTVALNLAFSLAHQLDCRTLLIDLNMKRPGIEHLLGVGGPFSVEDILSGNSPVEQALVRFGENLALGTTRETVEFSAELLQSSESVRVLEELKFRLAPDVILYDMPHMLGSDDVTAFLPNVDCALLVAAADHSTFHDVDRCEKHLAERTNLLGVVLNRCNHGAG